MSSVWFVYGSEHLHPPPAKESSVYTQCLFFSRLICSPLDLQHQSHLPASWSFPPENLPHGHLQSLSFFFPWQTDSSYWDLCLRRCKKNMSMLSPSLHCFQYSMSTYFMGSGSHLKSAHVTSACWFQSHSKPGRRFSWWTSVCSTLMHLSNP